MAGSCQGCVEVDRVNEGGFDDRRDGMALVLMARRGKDGAEGTLGEQQGNEDEEIHHGRIGDLDGVLQD